MGTKVLPDLPLSILKRLMQSQKASTFQKIDKPVVGRNKTKQKQKNKRNKQALNETPKTYLVKEVERKWPHQPGQE